MSDCLTHRPQIVRVKDSSVLFILNTGMLQGCVLSLALCTLFTLDRSTIHPINMVVKFLDDTTVVCVISKNDETHSRKEVHYLCCPRNNIRLNTSKTKEVIMDYR